MYKRQVRRLRILKHREKKPFAVMFPSLDSLRDYCILSSEEEKLLCSAARPLVDVYKRQRRIRGKSWICCLILRLRT